jgi:TctA family transporter
MSAGTRAGGGDSWPLAEEQLRRGLMNNRGDWMFLPNSNILLSIYVIALLAVFGPRLWIWARKSRRVA